MFISFRTPDVSFYIIFIPTIDMKNAKTFDVYYLTKRISYVDC